MRAFSQLPPLDRIPNRMDHGGILHHPEHAVHDKLDADAEDEKPE